MTSLTEAEQTLVVRLLRACYPAVTAADRVLIEGLLSSVGAEVKS